MKNKTKYILVAFLFLASFSISNTVDFAEFYSKPNKIDLLKYLSETVEMTDRLAKGEADGKVALEVRNRIGQIYYFYCLRFAPKIEKHVISNLEHVIAVGKTESEKNEASLALKTIKEEQPDNFERSQKTIEDIKNMKKS
jgi:hypothetical protein